MNVFILGVRITSSAQTDDEKVNILGEILPASERKVPTKIQLLQQEKHYVGKLLGKLDVDQTVLAIGPTKSTVDGILQMQPMLVVTQDNFNDLLALNTFIATGGLGPKTDVVELNDTVVTNRSLAWQAENNETNWFKLSAFGELSHQLSELAPGTPTIAIGKVSTSEKEEKSYLNYTVEKILYLPKAAKQTPKKAADPEKGKVSAAAIGSIDFKL
jgi:hypothetical protein